MTIITINDRQYRITYEQNSYYMVHRILDTPYGIKLFRVDDIEHHDVKQAYLDEQVAEQQEIEEHYSDFLAGTR